MHRRRLAPAHLHTIYSPYRPISLLFRDDRAVTPFVR
jgi:hypothetical protein